MAINVEWIWHVKPGRMDDFLAQLRVMNEAHRSDGMPVATFASLWQASVAGQNTGRVVQSFIRKSMADVAAADANLKETLLPATAAMTAAEGPASIEAWQIEQIVSQAGSFDGQTAWTVHGQAKPGREPEWRAALGQINEMVLAAGALGVLHQRVAFGGASTGLLTSASFYKDLAGWVSTLEHLNNDADWQALADNIVGPDGPVEVTSEQLWRRLAI